MESGKKETHAIFDQTLMKRTFEEYLLPFCSRSTVIQRCKCHWSKYQPLKGTLQAVYQVDFADPEKNHYFSHKLYVIVPGESRMVAGMPEKEVDGAEFSGRSDLHVTYLYLPSLKMLIQVFPTDMKLPQLRTLVNPAAMVHYLEACTHLNRIEMRGITVLKYKPEKRCLIRYDFAGYVAESHSISEYSAIGKTYFNDHGREIFLIMQFLRRSGLPIPEPLSYIPELKLLLTEFVRGRELESFVGDPNFPVYLKGAARTIAELHKIPVDRKIADIVSLEQEAERFAGFLERYQEEYPPLKEKIDSFASTILRKLKNYRGDQLTFVHGELDPSQLIVGDSKIWFVDFDLLKISHPATDVGRFLAYLNRLSLKLYGDPSQLGTMEKLFLEEYLSLYLGDKDLERQIRICQAMESVKISAIHFRRQKSGWKFRLSSIWDIAEKALSLA